VLGQLALGAVVVVPFFTGPRWNSPTWLFVLGAAMILLGLLVLIAGGGSLGRALTPFPKPLAGATLRDRGVYRIVRHPMYGGAILAGLGFALFTGPLSLAAALALGLFFELKSRREERWLVEHYADYVAYRVRTRWKFVPGIR
jgi:protein-S-isoprenylcysteine O-methyltransferase Ste14